jgi:hypothetical protein
MSISPNGTGGGTSAGNILNLTGDIITMHGWVMSPIGDPFTSGFFFGKRYELNTQTQYALRGTSGLQAIIGDGGTTPDTAYQAWTGAANIWYSIYFEKNGTGATAIYCEIKEAGGTSASDSDISNRNVLGDIGLNGFTIGDSSNNNNTSFDRYFAEVAVWNAILTGNERLALQFGCSAGLIRPTKLLGYWPLYGHPKDSNLASSVDILNVHGTQQERFSGSCLYGNQPPVGRATP